MENSELKIVQVKSSGELKNSYFLRKKQLTEIIQKNVKTSKIYLDKKSFVVILSQGCFSWMRSLTS